MIPIGDSLKKGPWSAAEDKILTEYVRIHGEGNWNALQRNTSLQRCGKSCRLRWANHLRPNLKKGAFSADEERLIIDLHSKLGNKWARISAQLPGRTDNEVKNYWNTRVKRRLRQGLPLYPNSHHSQPSFSSISSTQPPPNPPPSPPLPVSLKSQHSFLDPSSLPFPAPFFSFNHPPPGFFIPPSLSSFSFGFNSQHQHVELELPSNQFCPDLAEEDVENVYDYDEVEEEVKFYPNVGERSNNSGLLDALLIEAQSRSAAAKNLKKDCLDGDQWESICGNSSDGVAKMEEQDENAYYTNEDLSSILNLIPSLVTAPKCNQGRQQGSAGQSSNISDDNNAMLDAIPQVSSSNTEWFNTSSSYTSWDNLPRIY